MSAVTMTYQVRFKTPRVRPQATDVASRSHVRRVPRISRLMALAIKFDGLVRSGLIRNYSELAKLGNVTRARVTQIMNLNLLAPSIQEKLLFWEVGRAPTVGEMQKVAGTVAWKDQQVLWDHLALETF